MRKKTVEIDISNYIAEISGKMTFHYAVKSLYNKGLSARWKAESTIAQYNNEFNTKLFPNITDEKPLADLTKEDFDEAIDKISNDYYRNKREHLSESRVRHYKYLIRKVLDTAAKNGICDDCLWGTSYSLGEEDTDKGVERQNEVLQITQKSLTPKQELKVYNRIMVSPMETGQKIGLAIMFCCGVRNEEACGFNYDDLIEIPEHKGCYCLRLYKTTYQYSNELKGKGKTTNAFRVIPLPKALADLLLARKNYLQSLCENGTFQSVDDLPIVCNGDDFENRCIANHLTAAGRQLFKDIEADEKLIQAAEEDLAEAGSDEIDKDDEIIKMKEATTYLLRRNFATHIAILGLSSAEIQYVMGHRIEDPSFNRNDFNNPDRLYAIWEKFNKRPLVGSPDYNPSKVVKNIDKNLTASSENYFTFEASGEAYIHLITDEPNDDLLIQLDKDADTKLEKSCTVLPYDDDYNENVNVLDEYHNTYKNFENKKEPLQLPSSNE